LVIAEYYWFDKVLFFAPLFVHLHTYLCVVTCFTSKQRAKLAAALPRPQRMLDGVPHCSLLNSDTNAVHCCSTPPTYRPYINLTQTIYFEPICERLAVHHYLPLRK